MVNAGELLVYVVRAALANKFYNMLPICSLFSDSDLDESGGKNFERTPMFWLVIWDHVISL